MPDWVFFEQGRVENVFRSVISVVFARKNGKVKLGVRFVEGTGGEKGGLLAFGLVEEGAFMFLRTRGISFSGTGTALFKGVAVLGGGF